MLRFSSCLLLAALAIGASAFAQVDAPPADRNPRELPVVTRMMAYGKKEPGKVWRTEVTDERLHKLFDLADTRKEGVITKDQLVVAATKLEAEQPQAGQRGGPEGRGQRGQNGFGGNRGGGGPGNFGGGRGGPGGGGFGGRPPIGEVLPRFIQEELQLSEAQKQQVADLQKELDAKLDKILNDEQKQRYREMKDNAGRGGPGGFGGPEGRGRGGPEGRGGGGPGGFGGGRGGPPRGGPPQE